MNTQTTHILLIEDNPGDIRLIAEFLKDVNNFPFELHSEKRLSAGLDYLAKGTTDVVLLDLSLPDSQGFDTISRTIAFVPQIPIVMLTGLSDNALALKAVQAGAQDYLVKGQVNGDLLARTIRYAIERKQAEQVLAESEEKFKWLFEYAPIAYHILTPDGIITDVNRRWCQVLGYPKEEVLGKEIFDFIVEEERKAARASFIKKKSDKQTFLEGSERNYLTKAGVVRTFKTHDFLVVDQSQNITSVQTTLDDITERKQAERSLLIMSDTQRRLTQLDNLDNVYQLVGSKIQELAKGSYVVVTELDEKIQATRVKEMIGFGKTYQNLVHLFKVDPAHFVYYLKDMTVEQLRDFRSGKLEKIKGGLYQLLIHKVPELICKAAEKKLNCEGGFYTIGFTWQGLHFGALTILARSDITSFKETIEVIMQQASITINRIKTSLALQESEKRYRSLFEDSPISLWEQDFSAVKQRLDVLKAEGVTDMDAYLKSHPQEVADCISLIKIIDINKTAIKCYKAKDKDDLKNNLSKILAPEAYLDFNKELVAVAEGRTKFSWESHNLTLTGEPIDVSLLWSAVPGYESDLSKVIVSITDVTARKQAEKDIGNLAKFPSEDPNPVLRIAQDGTLLYANPSGMNLLPKWHLQVGQAAPPVLRESIYQPMSNGTTQWHDLTYDKQVYSFSFAPIVAEGYINLYGHDITKLKRSEQLLSTLNQAAVSMLTAETLDEIFTSISLQLKKLDIACMIFPIDQSRKNLKTKYLSFDSAALNTAEVMAGIRREDFSFSVDTFDDLKKVLREKKTIFAENTTELMRQVLPAPFKKLALPITTILNIPKYIISPLTLQNEVLGVFGVMSNNLSKEDIPAITAFANQMAAAWRKTELVLNLKTSLQIRDQAEKDMRQLITDLRNLTEVEKKNRLFAEALAKNVISIKSTLNTEEILDSIIENINNVVPSESISIMLIQDDYARIVRSKGYQERGLTDWTKQRQFKFKELIFLREVIQSKKYKITSSIEQSKDWITFAETAWIKSNIIAPILEDNKVIGFVNVDSTTPDFFTEEHAKQLMAFTDQVSTALKNAHQFEATQLRMKRMQAMTQIDQAINSSFDLNISLEIVLIQAKEQLKADAVDILLVNDVTNALVFSKAKGFKTDEIRKTNFTVGHGIPGKAVLERAIVTIPDLNSRDANFIRKKLVEKEGFISYYCVPLLTKGQLKGVMEVYFQHAFQADQEWLEFLEMLAQQTAIAINNADLLNSLQKSNVQLLNAYETTLKGWVDALDMRDKETEGHTQRVTELSLKLAGLMGINDKEIVNFQRGALLHDIGKVAVSDTILNKPGPLTDEEWVIMRKHPVSAFQLLSKADYLKPALDIPYCHHEKWDGSGYPRGLKGEAIPLTARIFAIIDVWDALTSDRPYRKAWTKKKALAYIREQSGKHFDPEVVKNFLGNPSV